MSQNHFRPDGMADHDMLPDELRDLHQRLAADGARWRDALPPVEPLARRVAALLEEAPLPPQKAAPSEGSHTSTWNEPARHDQTRHDQKGRTPMHFGRTQGWVAAAAALLVVGLMAVLLFSLGPARPGGHTTSRAIATAAPPHGQWEADVHLAHEAAMPFLAPSDPRVAYELQAPSANGMAHGLQRTDDAGATWHALPTPSLPGPLMGATFRVSPVDPRNVFLQVEFGVQMTGDGIPTVNCPDALASAKLPAQSTLLLSPLSNYGGCPVLFYSTDGGDHWAPSHLPLSTMLAYTNASWPLVGMNVLQAQGDRLYAALQVGPNGTAPPNNRLFVTSDKGATWQLADASLFSQTPAICDMAAAPQGTALFVLTSNLNNGNCFDPAQGSLTVWRSDDGGAQWTQGGTLPASVQQLVAAGGGNGIPSLLYATSLTEAGDFSLSGVRASADGGHTWATAPTAGIPASMDLYQIAGTLSDGSLVASMLPVTPAPATNAPGATPTFVQPRTAFSFTLYAWKVGATSWHALSTASPTISQPGYMLVTSGTTQQGTPEGRVWIVTLNGEFLDPNNSYSVEQYVFG